MHNQELKEEGGPYAATVEVKKICLDDDSFNYAAVTLKHFRWFTCTGIEFKILCRIQNFLIYLIVVQVIGSKS